MILHYVTEGTVLDLGLDIFVDDDKYNVFRSSLPQKIESKGDVDQAKDARAARDKRHDTSSAPPEASR